MSKKFNSIVFIGLIHLLTFKVWAQDKEIKKADKFFEDKDIVSALEWYEKAHEKSSEDPYVNLRIAQCHLLTRNKGKALSYAYTAVKKSSKPTSEMYYALAESNHYIHNFDSAIVYYKRSDPGNTNKRIISKKLNECAFGKKYLAQPSEAKITNTGPIINSAHLEYLPYITADGMRLYFTSRRPGSTGNKTDADGRPFEDIYTSFNKGGAWDTPVNVGSPLNTAIHDACVGLAPDGQKMFVYKGSNGGDIYESELSGHQWSTPKALEAVNTEFFESTACLSPDGRSLYFVRKAMGSRDIFVCQKNVGGAWSKPRKLEAINTEYDEDCPFIHPDGKTLYFSSKGHSSMGGYDIFKSVRNEKGVWSIPENLGFPINSASDDVYFVLTANGRLGFYSSDKEGGLGQQDLYSIRMPVSLNPELTLLKGNVKDEATGNAIEATISITDNETKELVAQFNSNKQTGEYLIPLPSGKNYGIAIESKGHLFHSENIDFDSKGGYKELKKDITLPSVKSGARVVLKNIFFPSGQAILQPQSTAELNRLALLLKQNSSVRIEISGHTDNTGDEAANVKLSQLRAKTVADYLIANGVQGSRLLSKGYGSSVPVASNTSEEGRQMNRRTEFKIL